jgi:hypothetical protein
MAKIKATAVNSSHNGILLNPLGLSHIAKTPKSKKP